MNGPIILGVRMEPIEDEELPYLPVPTTFVAPGRREYELSFMLIEKHNGSFFKKTVTITTAQAHLQVQRAPLRLGLDFETLRQVQNLINDLQALAEKGVRL